MDMSGSLAPPETFTQDDDGAAIDLTRQRYRRDDPPLPVDWNDTLATILSHRSVRAYLPDPLPAGTIETLVTAAQSASSSSNLQLWSVVAVEDKARKGRLAALAGGQKHIDQAPLLLVWLVDLARIGAMAEERGSAVEGLTYLESFLVGAVDTSPRKMPSSRRNHSASVPSISAPCATGRSMSRANSACRRMSWRSSA
jgi:Nitroreductase family